MTALLGRFIRCFPLLTAVLVTLSPTALAQPLDIPVPEPVRIGMSLSLTGPLAEFSDRTLKGVRMFERDINERGAMLARPVEIVVIDDQSEPAAALEAYRTLIDEQGISLLVSPYSSDLTLAVKPLVSERDVAMVSIASAPSIWDAPDPRIFGVYTPADRNADSALDLARSQGLNTIALAYHAGEFGEAVAEGVRRQAGELSMQVTDDVAYAGADADFQSIATSFAHLDPDVAIVASYLEDAVAFSRAAAEVGFAPKLMVFTGAPALREYGTAMGFDKAHGVLSTVQWMRSVRFPGSFDFGYRYRVAHGIYPSYDAAGGYAALQVLEAAVRLAQSFEPAQVREKLRTMKFRSILGHYRVDAHGMQTAKSTYLVQWQDAHISLVYPADLARWPLVYPFTAWQQSATR